MLENIETLLSCLRRLRCYDYSTPAAARETHVLAEKVFKHIFEIGQLNLKYSESEKKLLGYLLGKSLFPLQLNVEHTASIYRTTLDKTILIKRSAVQFLVDNFGQFPNKYDNGKLVDVLERNNIKESIAILDEIIRDYADASDSDEGSKIKVTVPHKVPASHTWWRS